jgi:hypothetical protein
MVESLGLAEVAPPPPAPQGPPTELQRSAHAALMAAVACNDPSAVGVALAAAGAPGSAELLALLATGDHAALGEAAHEASWHTVDVDGAHAAHGRAVRALRAVLEGYGPAGGPAVLHALRVGGRDALGTSLIDGAFMSPAGAAAAALVAAAGGPGSPGARDALAASGHVALRCYLGLKRFFDHGGGRLSALLETYGDVDDASALAVIGRWVAGPPLTVPGQNAVERDTRLALLIARTPEAWAPGSRYPPRSLLSPAVRAQLALPVLLALRRRLPPDIWRLVAAHLRACPWVLLSARVAVGALAAPPALPRSPLPPAPLLSLQTQRAMARDADPARAEETGTLCRLQYALSSFERRRVAERQLGAPPLFPLSCTLLPPFDPLLPLAPPPAAGRPLTQRSGVRYPSSSTSSHEEHSRAFYHSLQLQQPAAAQEPTPVAAAAAAAAAADDSDGDEPPRLVPLV